jgi:hypothetical protein
MSALPYPTYGITHLYLFPVYQTREAYKQATGVEAPPYDPTKPLKSWFDPKAAESTSRKLVYERVIAYADNGMPLASLDGKPVLEPLLIDRLVAATVNIPPKGPNIPDAPTTGLEIPVPLRALYADEELYFQFGGSVAVKNKALFGQLEAGNFTAADRALLQAIAEKLGISR